MKLYHYTDLAAAIGIIQEGRSLEFWGSRYDCMNDPFDYQFARNRIMPRIVEEAKAFHLQKIETEEMGIQPFIVSFSEKKDDFLMWRLYNAKVCLILDSEYFNRKTTDSVLRKCEYIADNKNDLRNAFHSVSKDIEFCPNIYVFSGKISTFIKNEAFKEEGEVRLATWDYYDSYTSKVSISKISQSPQEASKINYTDKDFQTRIGANGSVKLFKKFHIDGNALDGIIVHSYSEVEFEAIKELLRSILIQKGFSRDVFNNIVQTSAYPFNP